MTFQEKLTLLRHYLSSHGFVVAAQALDVRLTDVDAALHAWANYPQNIERFPKQLTPKR